VLWRRFLRCQLGPTATCRRGSGMLKWILQFQTQQPLKMGGTR
jgi:hypothetical protein